MKYFNGFCLVGEDSLFESYLIDTAYTVAGFSYGAQQALEYAYASKERIDRLILLSPAFFQTQKPSFVRAQLRYFESDRARYMRTFLENVTYPATVDISRYLHLDTIESLTQLLTYRWEYFKIEALLLKGVRIEVFFGKEDKIVDISAAQSFFVKTENYILKDAGHLLRGTDG